jgi:hypothetical protein
VSGTSRGKNVWNRQGWGESKVLSFKKDFFLRNSSVKLWGLGIAGNKQVMSYLVKVKIQISKLENQ